MICKECGQERKSIYDPKGPSSGSGRVIRGGSWINVARNLRSANRYFSDPGRRGYNVGFRLVRSRR